MKKLIYIIFIFLFIFNINISNASLDLVVTPIKYEFVLQQWEIITKTAKIINKSNDTINIYTWVSDFEAKDNYWTPKFVRKSELVNPNQELASWINIDTPSFSIWPLWEKEINFDIEVPTDAVPGWHYWWVFFKTLWDENSTSTWQLKINVDWEIIDDSNTWDPIINKPDSTSSSSSSWWGWYDWTKDRDNDVSATDNCKFGDFTNSDTDGKCFDKLVFQDTIEKIINRWEKSDDNITIDKNYNSSTQLTINNQESKGSNELLTKNQENEQESTETKQQNKENELLTNKVDEEERDFNIEISIPFENKGNTHIKPEWKITLIDENWEQINWVWKKVIIDENWMILWEEIVDYLPINDQWGNVLPNTSRIYTSEWKWFPYEDYNEEWQKVIKYWTPWDYYTRQNIADLWVIFPWQRINERLEQKNINAIIEMWYENYEGKNIQFNSAKEFEVDYKVKYVWLNPYFFLYSWIILIFLLVLWLILNKLTKKKCQKCNKKIKKNMKICPYCGAKQKNKK